ncbi:MAG: DMT family transporter [Cytophagales bacterium]|jgi:S-adenosylmethionine uptake transporter|nr:DMT family transporter [Cytophagales bacterium]
MNNKGKAALLTIVSVGSGSILDGFSKLLSERLPTDEIIAGRYFFACLTMLPLLFFTNYRKDFRTKRLGLHFVRGVLFCSALLLWVIGLKTTMIATTTLIGFTNYLFFIILAFVFLKENVSLKAWLCTVISFLSLFFVIDFNELSWTSGTVILLGSATLFALSDIINKKYANNETMIAMSFYSNLFAFFVLIVPVYSHFVVPSLREILLFLCLGFGSNFLLFTILKAYTLAEANFLTPFKFFEFISGLIAGFLFFREVPDLNNYISLVIILACNIYLLVSEKNRA